MVEDRMSPNPFAAINGNKLLRYAFVKRVRQTFHVFYGGFDRRLNAHAGIYDWMTFGIPILVKRGMDACHAEARRDSGLFYVPYAMLGLPHLVFTGLRIVFSALMTAASFLLVAMFHGAASLINACSGSDQSVSMDVKLGSPAKMEKAIGEAAHELGRGLREVGHQMQSSQGKGKTVGDKLQDTVSSSKQKLWKAGKGAVHKVKKEATKILNEDSQVYKK